MITTVADPIEVLRRPPAPMSLEEAGLSLDLVLQLVLKTLHFSGELTGSDLARRLGLEFPVITPALDLLKAQHQIAIVGGGIVGGASYRYRITDNGRTRAALFLETSHYVGTAPVPLAQYQAYLKAFRAAAPKGAQRQQVRDAFSHLVISDAVLDQLGPAINAGHSMFVYGPPGNGKTVISQAIHNLLQGSIDIPYALEIEGAIVRLFDPVNHEPIASEDDGDSLTSLLAGDRRWIRCKRPMVMVGGELTLDALELSYNPTTGFYRAPVQAIANGGVLVIDDFGRQQCSPRDLLNRWIVPLESRVDFLTLQSGQKFELPFMTLIVFATNIRPAELVDEAFLRRIQYKIFAESPTVEDYKKIFATCCRDLGATVEDGLVEQVLLQYYRPRKIALRGCHPRDLIKQSLSLASYLNRPPHLTYDLIEAACNSYFVNEAPESVVYA
jgi:predicted ATPase with chaperone activity